MYKKMLLAGAAGTLVLSAIAAPAMATPKLSQKQAVRAASGEYKFCVKNHNLKSFPKSNPLSCKLRFGKGYKEVSAASLGVAGPAGMNATTSPNLSGGGNLEFTPGGASTVPATFQAGVYQIIIDNYDPALKYTAKASIGTLGTVNACTTVVSNSFYMAANVGRGCIWLTGTNFVNQSSIVSVTAQGSGLLESTKEEIKVTFPAN